MSAAAFLCRLPLPPEALSPNRASHAHWRYRHKATAEYRMIAKGCFNRDKPPGWHAEAVVIELDYYCCRESQGYRPRDVSNALSSVKAAIDGMVDAGVVANDSAKYVQWAGIRLHSTSEALDIAPVAHKMHIGDGAVLLTVRAVTR